jgi:DNA-binding NarL/FixJ family response regulator
MSRKRVILASGSRLLREMLQHVINKAEHLEVVQELHELEELPSEIKRLDPEWVILPIAYNRVGDSWINTCIADYPSVRFIFLSPKSNSVKMKWQTSYEEDLTNLSLKDLIDLLERDLQHI